jgi:hypothetical protein
MPPDRKNPEREPVPRRPDPKLARLKRQITGGGDAKDEVYRRLAEAIREIMRRG